MDAPTAIDRDTQRGKAYDEFLEAVTAHLARPTPGNRRLVNEKAKAVDDTGACVTTLAETVDQLLACLISRDKTEWGKLLLSIDPRSELYQEMKDLSPFMGQVLISFEFCANFVRVRGEELEALIQKSIFEAGHRGVLGTSFLISFPKPTTISIDLLKPE